MAEVSPRQDSKLASSWRRLRRGYLILAQEWFGLNLSAYGEALRFWATERERGNDTQFWEERLRIRAAWLAAGLITFDPDEEYGSENEGNRILDDPNLPDEAAVLMWRRLVEPQGPSSTCDDSTDPPKPSIDL